jgi:RNA methyltransferase, TrmH family
MTNNELKLLLSLKDRKSRYGHNMFIAEGVKLLEEFLSSSFPIKKIYCTSSFYEKSSIPSDIDCETIPAKELQRISNLTTAQEVVMLCPIIESKLDAKELPLKISLVLDGINDPGNLGTIIRIADWFGIENIVCSKQTVDVYNSKVIQASMGSITRIKLHYTNLIDFITEQKRSNNTVVYGAVLNGENIYNTAINKHGLIVIGSESHGISEEVQMLLDKKIKIPSYGKGAESLNAAVATGIICSVFASK